jgi:Zn-dependent alcohol dehydrogenase
MRAAVLTEINTQLQIVDLEQEPPRNDEVRVHVKAAGVCMSDWHRRRDRGQTRRPCDLFVSAALRPMPLLLLGSNGTVHRPQ